MTETKEVEMGGDIKALQNHPDAFNYSDMHYDQLEDAVLYFVTKHIGYYEPAKRAGIFITDIEEVTEDSVGCVF